MSNSRSPNTLALAFALVATLARPIAAPATELRARGILDMTLSSGTEARTWNGTTQGDSNFDPYRVMMFVDAAVTPTISVYLWMNLHEGDSGLRADGAYAQWTPWPERDLHLQAGKVPWPIGTWEARSYSYHNPLVGAPLMYQYHTSLAWNLPTTSVDQLVASAGTGQTGLTYGAQPAAGMTVVDVRYWDVGVVLLGAKRPFEFSVGTMQGSPGWPVTDPDDTPGQTVLGRVGLLPLPGLRMGVSGAWGTWQPESFLPAPSAGASVRDQHEWTVLSDLEASRGRWEFHSEGYLKGWQTMRTGNLRLGGGYAEARVEVTGGAWIAGRWETMRFSDVTTSAGVTRPWDDPIDRMEAGVGYRVSRDVNLKASFQRNVMHGFATPSTIADLYSLALSVRI